MTTTDESSGHADRVIYLRPHAHILSPARSAASGARGARSSPVSDLAEFERTDDHDDYRHRMIVNAAALAFTAVLAAAGVWIAESMAVIRKNQDCVLMGRPACAQVPVPSADRWSASGGTPQKSVND